MPNLLEDQVKLITGESQDLKAYAGNVILVVNVASECGLTPQYKGLQELYEAYQDRGFVVLGFPCNQFGQQEPGSDQEIKEFCGTHYGVSFPMFSKVDVNGSNALPFFQKLKELSGQLEDIEWNFAKFLIHPSGNQVKRFSPKTEPSELVKEFEAWLPR